jgi:hypothetical protein
VQFAAAQDLDGDARPEVVFSTFSDWDYPQDGEISSTRVQHWLAVVDGRTGTFRWRQPLSTRYGLPGSPSFPSYDTHAAQMAPAFADLNGDGTLDLLVPAETTVDATRFELRALDGSDGTLLCQRRLVTQPNDRDALRNLSTPLAADVNGDGVPEVVLLEYLAAGTVLAEPAGATAAAETRARVTALSNLGRQKWQATIPVDELCGRAGTDAALQAVKPLPQLINTRDGQALVCIGLWGWSQPGKIAVFDGTGRRVALQAVAAARFRPWIYDVNGDGGDDVLVISENKLLALDPSEKLATIWQWPLPPETDPHIVGVMPRDPADHVGNRKKMHRDSPIVLVQASHMLYGISGRTGHAVWRWPGPAVCTAEGWELVTSDSLLTPPSGHAPRAVFAYGGRLISCVAVRPVDTAADAPVKAAMQTAGLEPAMSPDATRAAARADRRLLRSSPWKRAGRVRVLIMPNLWRLTLALVVIVLPGWTLLRLIARRRWGMHMMLVLPLLAACVLTLLSMSLAGERDDPATAKYGRVLARLVYAIEYAPVVVFSLALVRALIGPRWWRLLAWLMLVLALAVLAGGISLAGDMALMPHERYAFSDLELPASVGYFMASWVFVIGCAAARLLRFAVARLRRAMQSTASAPHEPPHASPAE